MHCRNCGNIVADDAVSCQLCGSNPADGNNYCPKCGHFCIPGDVECVQCKASLVAPVKLTVRKENNYYTQPQSQPQPQPQSQPQPQAEPQLQMQPQPQAQPQQRKTVTTTVGPKYLPDDQRYCRNCGLVIPSSAQKCPFCDSATGSNYCHKCGSGTTSSDTVCSVCSSPLTLRTNIGYIPSQPPMMSQNSQQQNYQPYSQPQQPYMPRNPQFNNGHMYGNGNMYGSSEQHDWLITLLLCFFLGALGVHRFYTKNYVIGIIQIVKGGGCGIWYVIDLIMILVDSYTDGNGNKLKRS